MQFFRVLGTRGFQKMAGVNYIDGARIKGLLKYPELITVVENALRDFSDKERGQVVQPLRSRIPVDQHKGYWGILYTLYFKFARD